MDTEIIGQGLPGENMYGCQPCPKCRGRYRWPDQGNLLRCDDCGYVAKWVQPAINPGPPTGEQQEGGR